jgi:small subunit ribosomal protein S17
MPKPYLVGVVVSGQADKTVVVRVEPASTQPVLKKKRFGSPKNHYAHDEKNEFSVGDVVRARGAQALSRLKRWEVIGATSQHKVV